METHQFEVETDSNPSTHALCFNLNTTVFKLEDFFKKTFMIEKFCFPNFKGIIITDNFVFTNWERSIFESLIFFFGSLSLCLP